MPLPLPSLEIQGFRTFEHLQLPRLGRANLLVGKNNSGKSSVLEAIRIYATRVAMRVLIEILEARDEFSWSREELDIPRFLYALQQLFRGHESGWLRTGASFRIGANGASEDNLSVTINRLESYQPQRDDLSSVPIGEPIPDIVVRDRGYNRPLLDLSPKWLTIAEGEISHTFVPPNGIDAARTALLWDSVTLTELEDQVVRALQIIEPRLQRISAVSDRLARPKRIMVARIDRVAKPVPLKSMGDGMNRFLGIALSLVNARDGILLIDEIENGIHFSVQERLWDLIFREARRLDVQVFATTHSWDCIEAFQRAARRDEGEEAALIRLDHRDGQIWPTTFSEHELSIVTREHIEVR